MNNVPMEERECGAAARRADFRVAAWITLLDVSAAAGSSLAALIHVDLVPDATPASHVPIILAAHAVGPRLALAGVCVPVIRIGSPMALIALGAVAALLQAFDAAAGAVQGDATMTVLPALLAMVQGYAIVLLDLAPRACGRPGRP